VFVPDETKAGISIPFPVETGDLQDRVSAKLIETETGNGGGRCIMKPRMDAEAYATLS
jgi:hypothetical protein